MSTTALERGGNLPSQRLSNIEPTLLCDKASQDFDSRNR